MIQDITLTKLEIGTIMAELYIVKNNLEFMVQHMDTQEKKDHVIRKLHVIRKILGQEDLKISVAASHMALNELEKQITNPDFQNNKMETET